MFIITARVSKNYGSANAVIGVAETQEKAEELIETISDPDYPFDFDEIDGYKIYNPKIIEVNEFNKLCVCLDSDSLDYSDA